MKINLIDGKTLPKLPYAHVNKFCRARGDIMKYVTENQRDIHSWKAHEYKMRCVFAYCYPVTISVYPLPVTTKFYEWYNFKTLILFKDCRCSKLKIVVL